jgi:hypothetical protein
VVARKYGTSAHDDNHVDNDNDSNNYADVCTVGLRGAMGDTYTQPLALPSPRAGHGSRGVRTVCYQASAAEPR